MTASAHALASIVAAEGMRTIEIRVRGRVQGVGFRPMVWRQARALRLRGTVCNDGEGVIIRAAGCVAAIGDLLQALKSDWPPLACVEQIDVQDFEGELPQGFEIVASQASRTNTRIVPDASVCADCAAEVVDPFARRYRYPFATCTNCGPRLSIVERVPYDRINTSMAAFDLCPACATDYENPADRRFHAETTACHACGPRARLVRFDGKAISFDQSSMLDDVDAALGLIQKGEIVAIKALGGYQLACDATRADAVSALRQRKQRDQKPFALMARDLDVIRKYCVVSKQEEAALQSSAAPIVVLRKRSSVSLPDEIAPGLNTLGFMLPSTPLHILLLRRMNRPVVMTSGNTSQAPQIICDVEAKRTLGQMTPFALVHDREIVNRVDDSVVRVIGGISRVYRRARGYAPSAIPLPQGFSDLPEILAFGGDLKSCFAITKGSAAVLSQHIGGLHDAKTEDDFTRTIALYREMFAFEPKALVADLHPAYRSAAIAERLCRQENLPLIRVQHHHAHIAACLAENDRPLDASPVLGIALDGLGFGADGAIWGGEFLLADYHRFERLSTFKPVAMLGGDQASREPWRNLYAHLMAEMGWANFEINFAELPLYKKLAAKPRKFLDAMLRDGTYAPKASSCGRLFDAVAAALDIAFEIQGYEGDAAARLESIIDPDALRNGDPALDYPFTIPRLKGSNLPYIEPVAVWNAILGDLLLKAPVGVISARFHRGLAKAIAKMAVKLAKRDSETGARFDTIALSGGCFNNRILFELVSAHLETEDFTVLSHSKTPAGDGGLALGQAAIAAAQLIFQKSQIKTQGDGACASAFPAA